MRVCTDMARTHPVSGQNSRWAVLGGLNDEAIDTVNDDITSLKSSPVRTALLRRTRQCHSVSVFALMRPTDTARAAAESFMGRT
jgi:hypothetical protein